MWTGEIREWSIRGGELDGRIYNSHNCRWTGWEYPDGSFITVQVYHYPDPGYIKYIPYDLLHETLSNYMRLTCCDVSGWFWDLKQTGNWNPCPLNFRLRTIKPKRSFNINKFILDSGCMVSEYPIGYNYWKNEIDYRDRKKKDMTIIEDEEDPDKAEVLPHPKLSVISGGKDNTGNWLINLKEGSVFLCRHKKKLPTGDEDFILIQFHIKKKWAMAVWIHSNFPLHQAGDYFVHSLKFSQQHELIDLLQDGEPEILNEGEE